MNDWTTPLDNAAFSVLVVLAALTLAYIAFRLMFALAQRLARRTESAADNLILAQMSQPLTFCALVLGVSLAAQLDPLLARWWEPLAQFLRPALLGWIAYALVRALTGVLELRLDAAADPVAVRSRRTRIAILSRAALVAIVVITVGLMLLAIPSVRNIGTTLLASAGLAAVAIGAAAQPALKSLIAGLQIAITEPLRLGDQVVVDGHKGRVEDIRLAYIVLRTEEDRAVVVPTARVLEQSFENWSRRKR